MNGRPGDGYPRRSCLRPVFAALLLSGTAVADSDYLRSRRLVESGQILPLQQILEGLSGERRRRVLEVELDEEGGGYVYEIELLGDGGQVWEYRVDAASGEILERNRED